MFSVSRFVQSICKRIVTLGPVGYLPAPGTMATLCAVPFVWLFASSITLSLSAVFLCSAIIACSLFLFKKKDPSEVVLDEVIGFFIAMLGITKGFGIYALGFVLFRLFDISKWFGVGLAERLPGWIGVVMDDVVAGLYTNLLLRLCIYYLL